MQMNQVFDNAQEPPAPFPLIRAVLRNKRLVVNVSTAAVAAVGFWAAYRTGVPDLYPLSVAMAAAIHLVLKVAVEVIELVAETLMPR